MQHYSPMKMKEETEAKNYHQANKKNDKKHCNSFVEIFLKMRLTLEMKIR